MTRSTPPSDWVAYVVVGLTALSILLGKHLVAKGDEPIDKVIKEDIEEIEEATEHIIDEVKGKTK